MRPIRPRRRARPVKGYRRLLVPLTDNTESRAALDVACRLAAERGATVVTVSVLELPPALPLDAHLASEEAQARALLERAEATAASFGVHTVQRSVRARDAGSAIVDEARAAGVELIVLGAARKTLRSTGALVFGDAVRHVLTAAPCRVLVVAARPELEPPAAKRATAAELAA